MILKPCLAVSRDPEKIQIKKSARKLVDYHQLEERFFVLFFLAVLWLPEEAL